MYRIRLMEPRDVPAIRELHAQQNRRDGTNYPLTEVFDERGRTLRNVPLALTILRGDEVRQGIAFEASAEMMLSGCDPRATAALHRQITGAFYLLRERGYGTVRCFVPKQVILPIERPLEQAGFERVDFRLGHFVKDLRNLK